MKAVVYSLEKELLLLLWCFVICNGPCLHGFNRENLQYIRCYSINSFFRLGLNVDLTHQNMSYRVSETKGNVEE